MLIESEDVELLDQIFGNPNCSIKNLEFEHFEVPDHKSGALIESIMKLERLFTFDFSSNVLLP